jgi:hypothetical protein
MFEMGKDALPHEAQDKWAFLNRLLTLHQGHSLKVPPGIKISPSLYLPEKKTTCGADLLVTRSPFPLFPPAVQNN